MPLKDTLKDQIVAAIAGATILGGGTVTLNSWYENGRQDVRIDQLEAQRAEDSKKLDDIVAGVSELRSDVRVIKERVDDDRRN